MKKVKVTEELLTFVEWLKRQVGRDDPIGDFAQDSMEVLRPGGSEYTSVGRTAGPEEPESWTSWYHYVSGLSTDVRRACHMAWCEYGEYLTFDEDGHFRDGLLVSLADVFREPPRFDREQEYRHAYCDGWIQAVNAMGEHLDEREPRELQRGLFHHWETFLRYWKLDRTPVFMDYAPHYVPGEFSILRWPDPKPWETEREEQAE